VRTDAAPTHSAHLEQFWRWCRQGVDHVTGTPKVSERSTLLGARSYTASPSRRLDRARLRRSDSGLTLNRRRRASLQRAATLSLAQACAFRYPWNTTARNIRRTAKPPTDLSHKKHTSKKKKKTTEERGKREIGFGGFACASSRARAGRSRGHGERIAQGLGPAQRASA